MPLILKVSLKKGRELAKIDDKIVVKVPMIKDGVKAIKKFSSEGIRTNCTLIFSAGQAILAAKAGASYVSPFIGRLDDVGQDGLELIAQIVNIYNNYGFETEILAASVRHTIHLLQCAELGADVVTCPLSVITGLLKHPLTDSGLEQISCRSQKSEWIGSSHSFNKIRFSYQFGKYTQMFSSDPVVSVKEASIFQDHNTILGNISFEIQKGEFVYLVGRTGSGKSSLLKTLYADLAAAAGRYHGCRFYHPWYKSFRCSVVAPKTWNHFSGFSAVQ